MKYYHPAGSRANGGVTVDIDPETIGGAEHSGAAASEHTGWQYTGLTVLELGAGESHAVSLDGREAVVVPLSGSVDAEVRTDDGTERHHLIGRETPWGVTDVVYAPVGSRLELRAAAPVRVAITWAVAERAFPIQYIPASSVPSELRGAGICSRQVNNFGIPGVLDADRIIVCEVMTPGGNWSSYPPHKHDVAGETETVLEEIYYYEVAPSPVGTPGFGLQRVYASEAGEIDVTVEVHTGDVVLIPHGYHGPSVAAPGHDLYYLNVMAGPADPARADRQWLISDDPQHTWIRESWATETIDPRLPFGGAQQQARQSARVSEDSE
ncbi:5-deoxy-glucuronate isomerase [Plantibacter sp. YIM 135249]|uniref:5-deoxy-glucuronate isomerase n=1 Tax=Plantibacter sp. YIM 135249 TaxID=3423918 RepID=UPI003D32C464